ncbi:MAG TPA: transposase [Bryobacteraceae bacterium]|nr:transposase [Bryobacteraceae bacterium]
MAYYERKLPHWQPDGAAIFLTWRLHGSLPKEVLEQRLDQEPSSRRFLRWDRALHAAATGPTWLKDPSVAACIVSALHYGESALKLYELRAWVIMSNQVHLFINPQAPLARINRSVRGFSAREANRRLARAGPFWQQESYDHWSRSGEESARIIRYIETNPVQAGLADRPEAWPWSSAAWGKPPGLPSG